MSNVQVEMRFGAMTWGVLSQRRKGAEAMTIFLTGLTGLHSSDGFQPLYNTNARQGCRAYFNRTESHTLVPVALSGLRREE